MKRLLMYILIFLALEFSIVVLYPDSWQIKLAILNSTMGFYGGYTWKKNK